MFDVVADGLDCLLGFLGSGLDLVAQVTPEVELLKVIHVSELGGIELSGEVEHLTINVNRLDHKIVIHINKGFGVKIWHLGNFLDLILLLKSLEVHARGLHLEIILQAHVELGHILLIGLLVSLHHLLSQHY